MRMPPARLSSHDISPPRSLGLKIRSFRIGILAHDPDNFGNIRKFVVYLMSCNLSEILIVGLAAGANAPMPLLPLQILFLNMVTDVFPALALAAGEGEGDEKIMLHPPRNLSEGVIGRTQWLHIAGFSFLNTAAVLCSLAYSLRIFLVSREEAVSSRFIILAIAQILHVFKMSEKGAPSFSMKSPRTVSSGWL